LRSLNGIRSLRLFGLMAMLTVSIAGCPSNDPYCGDGECQLGDGESASTCPQDCEAVCGDGACTGAETHAACARDCPVACGDGSCDGAETYQNCPDDCPAPPVCGDGVCDPGESTANCAADCPPSAVCGNGVCEAGENASNCAPDCYVAYCGNGVCDFGESEYDCFADCNDHCSFNQVDCFADDYCWTSGTNCSGYLYSCGGSPWRCNSNSDWAYCCSNAFVTCPASYPYYCPATNLCYSAPPNCSTATCSLVTADCGP